MLKNEKNMYNDFDYILKIALIGHTFVGKTSLLTNYLEKKFISTLPTLGMDTKFKILEKNKKKIKIHFLDTAGQERFRSLTPIMYKDIRGVIIVYDISNRKSFDEKKIWVDLLRENCCEDLEIMLIGNKCDLDENNNIKNCEEKINCDENGNKGDLNENNKKENCKENFENRKRKVMREEGLKFAKRNNFFFFETSAKNSENVEKAFEKICDAVIKKFLAEEKFGDLEKYDEIRKSVMKIERKEKVIPKKKCFC